MMSNSHQESRRAAHADAREPTPRVSNRHCRVRADGAGGTWMLEATHAGHVRLTFNDVPVAVLPSLIGSALLREESCPYERAAEVVAALCRRSHGAPCAAARADLEYGLARWIPLYFEL